MSKVKNELKNRKEKSFRNTVKKTDPITLTTGTREVLVNKALNTLFVSIKDRGKIKEREYRLTNVNFLMIDSKAIVANHSLKGCYIHMDSVLPFISNNLFGLEKSDKKVLIPEKRIIIP